MTEYPKKVCNIMSMQGEEAIEALDILDDEGETEVMRYLTQWDNGNNLEINFPAGITDTVIFLEDGYILIYNYRTSSIGLYRKIKE